MRNSIQLLKDSYDLLAGRWKLFGEILVVPAALGVLGAFFTYSALGGLFSLALGIVSIFMTIALLLVLDGRAAEARGAYKSSMAFFWTYLAVSILVGIAILLGLIALVIPGIILTVWFIFSTNIVVLEGKGIIDSIKQSREYVKGKWWPVFVRLLVLAVLGIVLFSILEAIFPIATIAGVLVNNVVGILVAPFALAYVYLMYRDVKGGAVMETITAPAPTGETGPMTDAM